ncbi:MAG TPA: hypothetical protein PKD45_15340 [Flavobacteriales bacterium]|nr:hypothetical protein [Flavobacteriales bacterium]
MRILVAAFLLLSAMGIMAQNVLYRSYEEYAENRGQEVEGPFDVEPRVGRFVVTLRQGEVLVRVPTRKVWGFLNRGVLYRIEQQSFLPVRLMAQGPIYYWENGFAHLRMQRDSVEASGFEYGLPSYLSRDLQSEIVPAVFKPGDTRSPSGKFRLAWPAYAALLERIGENTDMDQIRQEVVDYIVAVEEGRVQEP